MRKTLASFLVFLALAAAFACARTVATTWGYSSWYLREGFGDMGMFENQRNTCLSQLQVPDTATLAVGSPQETQFIQCMNASGWCTQMWDCNKPGA
ncbi:MAG TPA: hypothetical protein VFY49_13810 [Myxococcota bacterium]|nr:hypothetical protein [Myxococcota bacterium]